MAIWGPRAVFLVLHILFYQRIESVTQSQDRITEWLTNISCQPFLIECMAKIITFLDFVNCVTASMRVSEIF